MLRLLLLFNNHYLVRVTYSIFKIIPLAATSRCGHKFFLPFNQTQNSSARSTESVQSQHIFLFDLNGCNLNNSPPLFYSWPLEETSWKFSQMYVVALGYFFTKSFTYSHLGYMWVSRGSCVHSLISQLNKVLYQCTLWVCLAYEHHTILIIYDVE